MQAQYYQIEAERLQLSSSFGQVSIPTPPLCPVCSKIRAELKKQSNSPPMMFITLQNHLSLQTCVRPPSDRLPHRILLPDTHRGSPRQPW